MQQCRICPYCDEEFEDERYWHTPCELANHACVMAFFVGLYEARSQREKEADYKWGYEVGYSRGYDAGYERGLEVGGGSW